MWSIEEVGEMTERVVRTAAYILLFLWARFTLFPLYWLLTTALSPREAVLAMPPSLVPGEITMVNFRRLFRQAPILTWIRNSAVTSVAITAWHVLFDTAAGYAFAKRQFPGRNFLFWLLIASMMIPEQVTLVPVFMMLDRFGLIDKLQAVILPGMAATFGVFLMRQYIQTLPSELEEAARIDGCSELGIFTRIILPLCKPALGVLAIFTFVANWNQFMWPLIVLNSRHRFTLQVGLQTLQSEFLTDYGLLMAGASISALPTIVLFLFFQRYFISGLTLGGIKG